MPGHAIIAAHPADSASTSPAQPGILRRTTRLISSVVAWLFGSATLIVGLSALAVVPVLNFLSLGYLIECSGRVARSGRLRDGFIGIRKATVLGSLVTGTWLVILPLRFTVSMWRDAELIAPGSGVGRAWFIGLILLSTIAAIHITWAWLRGGKIRHFLWPAPLRFFRWLRKPDKYHSARDTTVDYIAALRLPHYFWLGARGFVGALAWLAVPVGILILASSLPEKPAILLSLSGSLLLMVVVLFLFLLQANFALTGRFGAMAEVHTVRKLFRQAPVAFLVALLVTLLSALPLYLLKIELTPREVAWLPSLLFVVFMFPARILTGWAMARANRRESPRHWTFRWFARLLAIPVAFAYVVVVYLTQYLSWHGSLSLLEQHAFLVPTPLMSL